MGRNDAGAATLAVTTTCTAALLAVLLAVAGGAAAVADASRARVAADAVALAVVRGSPLAATGHAGDPSREVADRVAAANGAVVAELDPGGWPVRVAVTVRVASTGPLAALQPAVRARAVAALRPPCAATICPTIDQDP